MRVSIFGMGYVGAVVAGCLSQLGHHCVGVDIRDTKIDMINSGISPIVEPGLEQLIADGVHSHKLRATSDVVEAVHNTDISMVCVGTPSLPNGLLDLTFVLRATKQIGEALRTKRGYHVFCLRSTVLPGTVDAHLVPLLESSSGKRVGADLGVAMNPEFLRESSAVQDFNSPPKTVIGELDQRSGDVVAELYATLNAPLLRTPLRVAEMVKYADNAFHALKITFANEIGALCRRWGVDSHDVMSVFCEDRKLNISTTYLRPGFAFGGSCLPKDLRALTAAAREQGMGVPVLDGIGSSNRIQIRRATELIASKGARRIGYLGVAFKPDSDDLRESPNVAVAEDLLGRGHEVRLYDKDVNESVRRGTCFYLDEHLPHLRSLFAPTVQEVLDWADVIVVGKKTPEFCRAAESLRTTSSKPVVDLVRLFPDLSEVGPNYEGICW